MVWLPVALALFAGLALGLLGGGGSILTVPILVYAAHLEAKTAVATSLLVVGATAFAGLVPHAVAGRVQWKRGAIFGAAGMAGAYVGGRVAALLSPTILLASFALMMLATAGAMLREKKKPEAALDEPPASSPPPLKLGRTIAEGAVVGAVTGLVGAGGGFLVVPALVVLGGLSMRDAAATSLLVIGMKSTAGLAGYLGHTQIPWDVALPITGAAIVGSVGGGWLASRVPERLLRTGFAWFVVVVAIWMIGKQLPESVRMNGIYEAVLVDRWPFWAGGIAIGAVLLAMLKLGNRPLGVSTGLEELTCVVQNESVRASWRLKLLGGIALGAFLAHALSGGGVTTIPPTLLAMTNGNAFASIGLLFGGGVLVGLGARYAGGCTSGHSILGVAMLARSSLWATAAFMATGFATTWLLVALTGR